MNIQKISIDKLSHAKYNPRIDLKHGDKEYEKLKRSIQEFGYVEPIVWNEQTGNIISGHQRFKILKELGNIEIDCVVVNEDEQKEKALNIAMNKISGDWDIPMLKDLLQEIDTGMFDITLTGFDTEEIEKMMLQYHEDEKEKEENIYKKNNETKCPECGYVF